jgi:putative transposase
MDFFTVPTLTFRVLYCLFVIEHGRRRILHFNITEHPTGHWIVQQLREAFPEFCPYRYAILDRDGKFGGGNRAADRQRHETHTHKPCKPLAEWSRGTLDRELSQRASRSPGHPQMTFICVV